MTQLAYRWIGDGSAPWVTSRGTAIYIWIERTQTSACGR